MIQPYWQGGEYVKEKDKKAIQTDWKQSGNIMLITAVLLLIVAVVVVTCIRISKMQIELSVMSRNTSNSAYLAEAGVEKQIDTINKALEAEMPHMVEQIGKQYLNNDSEGRGIIADADDSQRAEDASKVDTKKYDYVRYGNYDLKDTTAKTSGLIIEENAHEKDLKKHKDMQQIVREKIYEFLQTYYLVDETNASGPKPLVYQGKSDRQMADAVTTVTITPRSLKDAHGERDIGKIKLETTVETTATVKGSPKVIDKQKYETIVSIDVPETKQLEPQIHEYYEWVNKANASKLLTSPLTCFGDLVVEGKQNELEVTSGDVQVKGYNGVKVKEETGVIADVDYNGGVLVMNGGKLAVNDNLYCMNNVVLSNGWQDIPKSSDYNQKTSLSVGRDAIARTIGLVDDYYEGSQNQSIGDADYMGKNLRIHIGQNAMVDNDVMIDPFITHGSAESVSDIKIDGTLFGMSGGTDGNGNKIKIAGKEVDDPNSSSGVYSQGQNTVIEANRMIVGGQPFITLRAGQWPLKLFESIGEPFNGIASWKEYAATEPDPTKVLGDYLDKDNSPLYSQIRGDKVKTDIKNSFAIEGISALDTSDANKAKIGIKGTLSGLDDSRLFDFLFQGKTDYPITEIIGSKDHCKGYVKTSDSDSSEEKDYTGYLFSQKGLLGYYSGNLDYLGYRNMDFKKMAELTTDGQIQYKKSGITHQSLFHQFRGVKGYATAMRSAFYGAFQVEAPKEGDSTAKVSEQVLNFSDAVDLDKIEEAVEKKDTEWSYQNPIIVVHEEKEVKVNEFYVSKTKEGTKESFPKPTVIINTSDKPLTITTGEKEMNKFKGVIISKGPIILKQGEASELEIEGSIIAGKEVLGELNNEDIFKKHLSKALEVEGKITLKSNQDMLFKVEAMDRMLYRSILDALHLTQYSKQDNKSVNDSVAMILGPYKSEKKPEDLMSKVEYTMGQVAYSEKTYLSMKTEGIYLKSQSSKKIR